MWVGFRLLGSLEYAEGGSSWILEGDCLGQSDGRVDDEL